MPIICLPIYPSYVALAWSPPSGLPLSPSYLVSHLPRIQTRARAVVGALTLALGSWTAAEMAQFNVATRVAAALPDMLQEPNQVRCGGFCGVVG